MFPLMRISDLLYINYDIIFSVLCLIIINIIISNILEIRNVLLNNKKNNSVIFLIIFTFSLLMNGRLIFSFLGITLLFFSFIYYDIKKTNLIKSILFLFFGFIFSSVSSGTQLVYAMTIFFYFLIKVGSDIRKTNLYDYISILFLLFNGLILNEILFSSIYVNLAYYNYSIFDMLNHGFGKYLDILLFILILLPIFILFIMIIIKNKFLISLNYKIIFYLAVLISTTIGGIFGYSAFIFGIPVFIIIGLDLSKVIKFKV